MTNEAADVSVMRSTTGQTAKKRNVMLVVDYSLGLMILLSAQVEANVKVESVNALKDIGVKAARGKCVHLPAEVKEHVMSIQANVHVKMVSQVSLVASKIVLLIATVTVFAIKSPGLVIVTEVTAVPHA